ncbi:MAG: NAD(P)H-dependent oxidoreductase [Planctomycetes bacterium]|nr:NAD(P)H-dependent oxidoreductase [Planctomycetota bacterium]
MAQASKILAFAGSLRVESWNKKLLKIAVAGARAAGADVTVLDLRDLPLPIFDEDLEKAEGLPPNARKLKDLLLANRGLLIASPEYNSSISAALKNAIDWASRPVPGEKPLECFVGKVAGLVSASPGALGGLRGLVHVRAIFGNIHVLVIPDQVAVSKAHEAFAPDGSLRDAKQQAAVAAVGEKVARLVAKLGN